VHEYTTCVSNKNRAVGTSALGRVYRRCRFFPASDAKQTFIVGTIVGDEFQKRNLVTAVVDDAFSRQMLLDPEAIF
jgi:hypothetical protein